MNCPACGAPMRLIWAGETYERMWCDACGAVMSIELAIRLYKYTRRDW